jgi:hypothetical protein
LETRQNLQCLIIIIFLVLNDKQNRMNSIFCEHLQHTPASQPICSHVGGRFVPFPVQLEEFPMDVVAGLVGYTLVTTTRNGVNRFALRTPSGNVLEPMDEDRRVCAKTQGATKYYNAAKLLASYVLGEDVTDNEHGILIAADGLWIESAADRVAVCTRLKLDCNTLPRVELDRIPRPNSSDITVRGKGYYVERGVVYQGNGTPIHVSKTGHIYLTGAMGKQEMVGLGWILFAAYPAFYGYRHGLHVEMDHINGISTDNEAWNFRPMTIHQNAAVSHRTGSRVGRPAPDSSHELFKRDHPEGLTTDTISKWIEDKSLRQYAKTPYWMHRDGAVLRRRQTGSFDYAPLCVNRCGYTFAGRGDKVHVMMMKAFDMYVDGLVVMHGDDNKENNRLSNLQMGTNEDNAWRQYAVQIHIRHADGTVPTTYRSEREAARRTGISLTTINQNRKRQRPGSPLVFSTSRGSVFAATDPPQSETVPV